MQKSPIKDINILIKRKFIINFAMFKHLKENKPYYGKI